MELRKSSPCFPTGRAENASHPDAPRRRRDELARLGWLALLGGTLSCFLMACVATMLA